MIQCPLCRKENPDGHRFCVRCAKDLGDAGGGSGEVETPADGRPCPGCGAPNAPGHRFCLACGIPLSGAPLGGRTETHLAPSRPAGEPEILHILPDRTASYRLEDQVVIGRAEGTLRFPEDRRMSRAHAVVRREAKGALLEDLGSTNGTFIRVVDEVELRPGDVILLGDQLFQFRT